jgi:hypothetical protein
LVEYTDAMPLWPAVQTDGSSTSTRAIIKMQSGAFKVIFPRLCEGPLDIQRSI